MPILLSFGGSDGLNIKARVKILASPETTDQEGSVDTIHFMLAYRERDFAPKLNKQRFFLNWLGKVGTVVCNVVYTDDQKPGPSSQILPFGTPVDHWSILFHVLLKAQWAAQEKAAGSRGTAPGHEKEASGAVQTTEGQRNVCSQHEQTHAGYTGNLVSCFYIQDSCLLLDDDVHGIWFLWLKVHWYHFCWPGQNTSTY